MFRKEKKTQQEFSKKSTQMASIREQKDVQFNDTTYESSSIWDHHMTTGTSVALSSLQYSMDDTLDMMDEQTPQKEKKTCETKPVLKPSCTFKSKVQFLEQERMQYDGESKDLAPLNSTLRFYQVNNTCSVNDFLQISQIYPDRVESGSDVSLESQQEVSLLGKRPPLEGQEFSPLHKAKTHTGLPGKRPSSSTGFARSTKSTEGVNQYTVDSILPKAQCCSSVFHLKDSTDFDNRTVNTSGEARYCDDSIDSDATIFMEKPLHTQGVTSYNKDRKKSIAKSLKKIGRQIRSTSSRNHLETLAVL